MEDIDYASSEQLKRYKQTLRDIRYIFKTYKRKHPDEAWHCISTLAHDPNLNLRQLKENT